MKIIPSFPLPLHILRVFYIKVIVRPVEANPIRSSYLVQVCCLLTYLCNMNNNTNMKLPITTFQPKMKYLQWLVLSPQFLHGCSCIIQFSSCIHDFALKLFNFSFTFKAPVKRIVSNNLLNTKGGGSVFINWE